MLTFLSQVNLVALLQETLVWGIVLGLLACMRYGGLFRAFFSIPATFAHELAHFLVALVFCARPSGFNLTPQREGKGWRLGSIAFQPTQINGAFIALAPLFLLPPLSIGLAWWAISLPHSWHRITSGFVIGTLLVGSWPSWTDWKIACRYPIGGLTAAGLALWIHYKGVSF